MLRALVFLGLLLALAAPVSAQDFAGLGPEIPKATGDPHPEGNRVMRRRHMEMMRHDRDMTMHDGEREIDASISECFECHSVKDEAGGYVTYESEKHFCRACHDFVAVKVDCFMCHRSTPEGFEEPALHAMGSSAEQDIDLARTYLEGLAGEHTESGRPE
ncbi:hypothetical protein [Aliiruegeria lutimaris]|uniref:Uncharacterized protein n=1 Tax=Aliiruegeria lutimaris TaxID=571298 RepID=A0A1G8S940_9RHOB|nr:hypothetical protein [Aliiruegeria lutimaris]SDJ25748.1 hypothetical protein SAMN04488026_101489 [Aliiruegeria lutimaris]